MRCSPHAAANLLQFAFMSESHAQDRDIAQDRVTAWVGCGWAVRCPLYSCWFKKKRKRDDIVSPNYGVQDSSTLHTTPSFSKARMAEEHVHIRARSGAEHDSHSRLCDAIDDLATNLRNWP